MSDRPTTREEAVQLALDWAEGRRSWANLSLPNEVIAVMDAQEVVKWAAVATVLPAEMLDGRDEALRDARRERSVACDWAAELAGKKREAERERDQARDALARAVFLAEHLWAMVPQAEWRDHGGDDGQGHYEGDYHAEQVAAELKTLAALGGAAEEQ